MPVYRLPYQANGAVVFSHFADKPNAIFLDSCGVDRFDIIVADPIERIVTHAWDEDPFLSAKTQLANMPVLEDSDIPKDLPFTIGAIGYFNYDLGYGLEKLTPTVTADVGFPSAIIGLYEWSIVIDHAEKVTYFINRYPQSDAQLAVLKKYLTQPATGLKTFSLTSSFSANTNKDQYAQAFAQVKNHIYAGDCYQINLAQRFTATYTGSPWVAYQQLRQKNPMPMAAYIHLGDQAILSLSPERFLQVKNRHVMTQPIKGTSPRFDNPIKDQESAHTLSASEKDRAENIMIVDLLRNDLSKTCQPYSVQVPQLCELESFSNVHHLVSTVTGILENDQDPFDLLRHCFPGGSITGAPKRRAMEIIDDLEQHQRALYCGSIAYCDVRGYMDSSITIRTFLCNDQRIYCYGGGGLVSDSTMESEYQEIRDKISRLLKILEES